MHSGLLALALLAHHHRHHTPTVLHHPGFRLASLNPLPYWTLYVAVAAGLLLLVSAVFGRQARRFRAAERRALGR